ncbi:protein S40-1-like [Carex rostrata]
MEEFLEAEVLWPEKISKKSSFSEETISNFADRRSRDVQHNSEIPPSSPITIPCSPSSHHHFSRESTKWGYEEECTELVPPHVMVSRKSNGGEIAISLRSGQGRTLRGRELRHIRNAVWRMTGFVDG